MGHPGICPVLCSLVRRSVGSSFADYLRGGLSEVEHDVSCRLVYSASCAVSFVSKTLYNNLIYTIEARQVREPKDESEVACTCGRVAISSSA